jgi:hypothetical protein
VWEKYKEERQEGKARSLVEGRDMGTTFPHVGGPTRWRVLARYAKKLPRSTLLHRASNVIPTGGSRVQHIRVAYTLSNSNSSGAHNWYMTHRLVHSLHDPAGCACVSQFLINRLSTLWTTLRHTVCRQPYGSVSVSLWHMNTGSMFKLDSSRFLMLT